MCLFSFWCLRRPYTIYAKNYFSVYDRNVQQKKSTFNWGFPQLNFVSVPIWDKGLLSHVNVKQLFSPFISFNLHSSMTSKAVWIFERSLRIHGSYYALFWTYLSCTHRTHYIFWLKIKETSQSRSKKSVSACQIFYFCHCCCMVQPIDQIRKKDPFIC